MPQSAEHLQILDFLGVERGVVALTKTDIAGDLADVAEEDVREHLAGTSLADARIVRVSAVTGSGLDELLAALDDVLPSRVASVRADERAVGSEESHVVVREYREGEEVPTFAREGPDGRARLYIDRSFNDQRCRSRRHRDAHRRNAPRRRGSDTPSGRRTARIRSLQTHGDQIDVADAPRRLALNLVGIDRQLVRRGDVIVTDDWPLTNRFVARLRSARGLGRPLKEKGAYELFTGSAQTRCRFRFVDEETLYAEIHTDDALALIPQDRFVIRDLGRWRRSPAAPSSIRIREAAAEAIRRCWRRCGSEPISKVQTWARG